MKRLYALIAILLVFLGFAYVKENDPNQAADRKHTPTVGILQLMSQPALDTIHHGIIQGLKDGGFTPRRVRT